jgi:KDO2-lipid IV(A) lauroyltransferase
MRRVVPDASKAEIDRLVSSAFASYARYWAESFRLPHLSVRGIDDGLEHRGYHHILDSLRDGRGVIMVVPHLGGWEWAAAWLARVAGHQISAVVEAIEPPELFEWFRDLRRAIGIDVIGLGPRAGVEVAHAVESGHIVCLLADRRVGGAGTEVCFFGEATSLPAGPATLALRTGAALIPCAVYFTSHGVRAEVGEPFEVERRGRLREDVARITRSMAAVFESQIRAAPDQWHLMQPNWPSDLDALGDFRATRSRNR